MCICAVKHDVLFTRKGKNISFSYKDVQITVPEMLHEVGRTLQRDVNFEFVGSSCITAVGRKDLR